jgi:hypothetical protein
VAPGPEILFRVCLSQEQSFIAASPANLLVIRERFKSPGGQATSKAGAAKPVSLIGVRVERAGILPLFDHIPDPV